MTTIRQSLLWAFAEKYFALVLNILSTLIIARLLTPEEIGIFSVSAVFVAMAHLLRDFGVGQYIVQEKELSPDKLKSAFGVTLIIAWSVAVLLFVFSNYIAAFYKEDGIQQVMYVLAANFILIPFSSVILSLLNRELKFNALFRIKTIGVLFHTVTSLTLAYSGYGYMSLAWAAMANIVATIIAANFYRPKNFPLFPGFREYRVVLSFGYKVSSATIMKEVGDAAPDLVIGRSFGMEYVGFFSRALGTVKLFDQMVLDGINQITLPHFSRIHRVGKDLSEIYFRAISYITVLAWPFFTVLALLSYPIIRTLYGDQWDTSIPVLRYLCIYAIINALNAMYSQLFIAVSELKKVVQFELIVNFVVVILILLSVNIGFHAIAWALIIKAIVGFSLVSWFVKSILGASLIDYVNATYKSLIVTICTSIVPVIVTLSVNVEFVSALITLPISFIGAAIGWIASVIVTKHPLLDEINLVLQHFKDKRNTKKIS